MPPRQRDAFGAVRSWVDCIGERQDRAVADPSGQFVIVPPRLPPGSYELTLRSKLPDGTLATSKQGVVVAVDEGKSSSGGLQSHVEVPFNVTETTATNRQLPHTTADSVLPDEGPLSAVVGPKIATTIVSRGDSLWRISHAIYGAGTRYAVVYKANRPDPRSKSHLSRPNLYSSREGALKRGDCNGGG